jgi:hypothetical protein
MGSKTGMKTIAFEAFWIQMRMDSLKDPFHHSEKGARAYLNVNPEGALLREAQDIAEELRMMSRIFTQQYQVVKDFKKALEKLNDREDRKQEPVVVKQFRKLLESSDRVLGDIESEGMRSQYLRVPKSTLLDAGELLEQILERRAEIEELEEAAKRTCQQVCPVSHFWHVISNSRRSESLNCADNESTASRTPLPQAATS